MATNTRITGAPARAPIFELNGCTNAPDEPYPYLDQAHAVLAFVDQVLSSGDEDAQLNPLLVQSAVRAASTLVHLAATGLHAMDRGRGGK